MTTNAWKTAPLQLSKTSSSTSPSQQSQQHAPPPPMVITFDVAPKPKEKEQNVINQGKNQQRTAERTFFSDETGDGKQGVSGGSDLDPLRGESKRDREDTHNDHKNKQHRVSKSQRT